MTHRDDAIAIWKAGVTAVDSTRLVQHNITCTDSEIIICGQTVPLAMLKRIEVVGAGKAGAGMAEGVLAALQHLPTQVPLSGWLNVPEDCVKTLPGIHLHAARPAGVNEPTSAGVQGTLEIIHRVAALGEHDLCIVLISGGGSALLPAPVSQISLDDKLCVTRILAAAGATIQQLNVVRSQLSDIKGGGLLQHARATRVISLIISDVIGDPLESIASGPTVPTVHSAADALAILELFDPQRRNVPTTVYDFLNAGGRPVTPPCPVSNHIIGSNQVALDAATHEAQQRGYQVIDLGAENQGDASALGRSLFTQLSQLRDNSTSPVCVLAGGESTVQLVDTSQPRKGGRNQEVVLAAITAHPHPDDWHHIALLSGGTDGEDGPTDAAGAFADSQLVENMQQAGLSPESFLSINNAYPFFQKLHGLLLTGPTHTNVMDLAVGVSNPMSLAAS